MAVCARLLRYESSFCTHDKLRCLTPYFDHVVLKDANVFVMNVLVVPPSATESMDGSGSIGGIGGMGGGGGMGSGGGLAVRAHWDNTLAICTLQHSFLAHQVDVCYLSLPEGMKGGELCVWTPPAATASTSASASASTSASTSSPPTTTVASTAAASTAAATGAPDEIVSPQLGLHVSFRGDAKHGVRAWSAASEEGFHGGGAVGVGTARVSLVLEQYIVPEVLLPRSTAFEILAADQDA